MHVMAIKVSTAELIGTILEVLGYGIYLVVAPQAFLAIRSKRLRRGLMIYLYSTMLLTFCLITAHLAVDLTRMFTAFTVHTDIPNAPEAFYANVDTSLNITKNAAVVCATLIADALLIYRTLIVWGRRWLIIVLPVILYFLDIATSIWFTWSITEAPSGHSVLGDTAFARSAYFFATTLAVNLVCTCLISFKIWRVQRAVVGYVNGFRRARNALLIVLESAAIYTAALVCMIILACVDSAALFFFLNSMPPLIGTVFTFVVLRSSSDEVGRSSGTESYFGAQSASASRFTLSGGRISMKPIGPSSPTASEGVHVHLERIVRSDTDNADSKHEQDMEINVEKDLP
ncbi:hypothetical protein AX14_011912 [Amanita brunnescens Koide BX004]|nr:hypothetical protein AX14_011912 [Amanita brunnescens Koide BX004]